MIFKKVNNYTNRQFISFLSSRCLHHDCINSSRVLHPLESRRLLKISGNEATTFLQGLITNDMRHFEEGANSMYSMFLNNKGRVLFENLIYKRQDESYLIECDSTVLGALQKHLKMFKLRKKLTIDDINNEFKLWVLTNTTTDSPEKCFQNGNVEIYSDPRLADLGFRVIAPSSLATSELATTIGEHVTLNDTENEYKYLRYNLGVSEGASEVNMGSSFPLEANCDYLHGVSFHKGCYIGQELTARTHHTGVVRKRIMPLIFNETVEQELPTDAPITSSTNPKLNIGKFKGVFRDRGLALVRIKEAMEAESLVIGKNTAKVLKPSWWPVEAPKMAVDEKKDGQSSIQLLLDFECSVCNIKEKVHYKGSTPPFSRTTILKYPSYIMKDPFSPPGKGEILVIGADCSLCKRSVCINKDCSLFYSKTYCIDCVMQNIKLFPPEITQKFNKK